MCQLKEFYDFCFECRQLEDMSKYDILSQKIKLYKYKLCT